jgi:hypothetical protein
MSTRNIIIENLDTLAYGVLDPRTVNHLQAYDCMRSHLDMELDNRLIDLLAVIVRLGDMGEEEVSMDELKAAPFKYASMADYAAEGVRLLEEAGLLKVWSVTTEGTACECIAIGPALGGNE